MDLSSAKIPVLQSHPNFAQAMEEFRSFLDMAEEDVSRKRDTLAAQAKSLGRGTTRNYLDFQIFMLSKHSARIGRFREETSARLEEICDSGRDEDEALSVQDSMVRLLADVGKLKRRCKHILDVTDRFCVVSDLEIAISSRRAFDRVDSLDSSTSSSGSSTTSSSAASASSFPPPDKARGRVAFHPVKATFQSFGSHISVIAKSYTRKRAPATDFAERED